MAVTSPVCATTGCYTAQQAKHSKAPHSTAQHNKPQHNNSTVPVALQTISAGADDCSAIVTLLVDFLTAAGVCYYAMLAEQAVPCRDEARLCMDCALTGWDSRTLLQSPPGIHTRQMLLQLTHFAQQVVICSPVNERTAVACAGPQQRLVVARLCWADAHCGRP